jgi:protein-tyrosine-phosphatase
MYMHIGGSGSAPTLAAAVKKVLDRVTSVRSAAPTPPTKFSGAAVPDTNSITAADLDAILGVKGEVNNGMYKATIGRTATMHGAKVAKQMGVNTWAAFAGTDANALVDGDFAMTAGELQTVLKALRKAGINIVAIHNHMTHEEPQYVFLHYWGKGPAKELARGLKSALDEQARGGNLKADSTRNVLFVCEHGAAKSVIAAAEFNRLAQQRGLSWRAAFRGTSPDADIAPAVAQALGRDGLTVDGKPSLVTISDVEASSQVVTFATKLPRTAVPASLREWNDVPSPSSDLDAARRDIRLRVAKLLDEIVTAHQ